MGAFSPAETTKAIQKLLEAEQRIIQSEQSDYNKPQHKVGKERSTETKLATDYLKAYASASGPLDRLAASRVYMSTMHKILVGRSGHRPSEPNVRTKPTSVSGPVSARHMVASGCF